MIKNHRVAFEDDIYICDVKIDMDLNWHIVLSISMIGFSLSWKLPVYRPIEHILIFFL
jgi:hypothetical protein